MLFLDYLSLFPGEIDMPTNIPNPTGRSPLSLPLDVVLAVFDHLDPSSLAAVARACHPVNRLVTPRLYGRVVLRTDAALGTFAGTLESRPEFRTLVRELGLEFAPSDVTALTCVLIHTSRLRSLRVGRPLPSCSALQSALACLDDLQDLELSDATSSTLSILQHIRTVRILKVHCWPSALPTSMRPPEDVISAIVAFIARSQHTLQELELNAAILQALPADMQLPRLKRLTVHGRYDGKMFAECESDVQRRGCASPCDWCAPLGAVALHRSLSFAARKKEENRPCSFVRWLASHFVSVV
ncbi:hypothetical protein EXIGLDRAFT_692843 [Exidia glandulosa HHB12029]|uniref:F-box domain-containing protein n=1 Tax=Exidia glandulosa HHB12029 TaxID=1314781 RepID=A0A165NX43_EXIGL|nr:hypothetical protein EXIGLDRAFT_692843 [Exidia glandulosa HHB12029]